MGNWTQYDSIYVHSCKNKHIYKDRIKELEKKVSHKDILTLKFLKYRGYDKIENGYAIGENKTPLKIDIRFKGNAKISELCEMGEKLSSMVRKWV